MTSVELKMTAVGVPRQSIHRLDLITLYGHFMFAVLCLFLIFLICPFVLLWSIVNKALLLIVFGVCVNNR